MREQCTKVAIHPQSGSRSGQHRWPSCRAEQLQPLQPSQVPNRVAVAQMTSTGEHLANLATCRRLAEQASAERCSMLFLPECCAFIGLNSAEVSSGRILPGDLKRVQHGASRAQPLARWQTVAQAQPLDGPLMQQFQQLARDTGGYGWKQLTCLLLSWGSYRCTKVSEQQCVGRSVAQHWWVPREWARPEPCL